MLKLNSKSLQELYVEAQQQVIAGAVYPSQSNTSNPHNKVSSQVSQDSRQKVSLYLSTNHSVKDLFLDSCKIGNVDLARRL